MNKQELFETMLDLWNEFEAQHNGTTKKSQQHTRRGYCCGNVCRHCPYQPKNKIGEKTLKPQ